jgi:hypothetical protein
MPGLQLTREQARRLFGVDDALCAQVLNALVESGFLRLDGFKYRRATQGRVAFPRRASLIY